MRSCEMATLALCRQLGQTPVKFGQSFVFIEVRDETQEFLHFLSRSVVQLMDKNSFCIFKVTRQFKAMVGNSF